MLRRCLYEEALVLPHAIVLSANLFFDHFFPILHFLPGIEFSAKERCGKGKRGIESYGHG
jgi:hypothetical protein